MYFPDVVHYLDALICFVLHLTFCTFSRSSLYNIIKGLFFVQLCLFPCSSIAQIITSLQILYFF
nr:MAG TPA: hypothetical protein [Caudoviricetes sp.]